MGGKQNTGMEDAPPFLTLTTDFGSRDGYVGAIKGRVATLFPPAVIHDISHDISPYNITQGAWCLRRAAGKFPAGTVHLAVVDPGVGSSRGGLIVDTERYMFVGPDNGLLFLAAQADGIRRAYRIRERQPEGGPVWHKSNTFDGLELFAPVAARLLAGVAPETLGDPLDEFVALPEEQPWQRGQELFGRILFFDHFGNGFTNITREHLSRGEIVRVEMECHPLTAMLEGVKPTVSAHPCEFYEEILSGVGALINSDGHLELAVKGGTLREQYHLRGGEGVRVSLRPHV
ncbi:MAG: SAM-dependent chlorinase/fluorinase [Deltaproteobacteria bacterium]|nr:SAM-dependent chlorinase/fluorinase [Deltaproteobacteria bacterium]